MKDWRVLPKIVLFEGINLSGKTTLINQFKERYPKQIEVIKFPRQPDIIKNIIYLYRQIAETKDKDKICNYLEIIHQLFDLDFRQFTTAEYIKDLSKVYFLDRYYPSNFVYADLHGVNLNPAWVMCHNMRPDIVFYLQVNDEASYYKNFPAFDNTVEIELKNKIKLTTQLLTPERLFTEGQVIYNAVLRNLLKYKFVDNVEVIPALQEDTFRKVEKILIRQEIL